MSKELKENIEVRACSQEPLAELELFDGSAMTETVAGELPPAEAGTAAPAENLVPLSRVGGLLPPLSFALSSAGGGQCPELPPDAIVQGEDGVFRIAEDLKPEENLDEDFRRLVDSVLK
ncbi:MAG: hypothetical protein K2H09_07615 [Treponemataceae bacterium]|nr:hypothetical protein [Treponemataceae bacterium]